MDINSMTDLAARAEEGTWVQYEDAEFLIRSASSKAYRRALQKASKGKSNHRLTKDLEVAEKFGVEALADGILIDWKNITENGKQLECTRENKIKLLQVAYPIRDFIATQAQDFANFEAEKEEDDSATFHGEN